MAATNEETVWEAHPSLDQTGFYVWLVTYRSVDECVDNPDLADEYDLVGFFATRTGLEAIKAADAMLKAVRIK